MKRVILDTNFLLIPGQVKFDVFTGVDDLLREPFDIYVTEGTLEELKSLAEGGGKDAQAAKLGYVLAQQKGLKTLAGSESYVDDALVELADENTIIATQDKELKKRVKEAGGKVIIFRKKQKLELEG